ncbi:hypothetical protein LguiA_024333 [Lonicera macranthoides]
MKNAAELVFIPAPLVGHLASTVQIAQSLIDRDQRLSITVLVMSLPFDTALQSYTQSLVSVSSNTSPSNIKFVNLPQIEPTSDIMSKPPNAIVSAFIDSQKSTVRDAVIQIIARSAESTRLAGFVIDMFCVNMIDVANEFALPTYVYFTSNAGFLGFMFHIQTITDELKQDVVADFWDTNTELLVPSFTNPVPAKVLPSPVLDKEGAFLIFLLTARRFRETKGIMINTFFELEPHAMKSLQEDTKIPPVYSVGPLLNLKAVNQSGNGNGDGDGENSTTKTIARWLDGHPPSSVVFLCFGSQGSFMKDQVKEIATALECIGHRFLWSLRRPPASRNVDAPTEYSDPEEVLPEGFLERTAGIGKVIGWAPQMAVLSHAAIGGFVTHCGWNSILESLWFGVPMAAWPMYAEQQINAFEMATELGLAVEIKMDYRNDREDYEVGIVAAEDIERGIREMMKIDGSEMRKKVKEMREKSRMVVRENGSSYRSLGHFIEDVMDNIPEVTRT